jgi:hypothetical protein
LASINNAICWLTTPSSPNHRYEAPTGIISKIPLSNSVYKGVQKSRFAAFAKSVKLIVDGVFGGNNLVQTIKIFACRSKARKFYWRPFDHSMIERMPGQL